MTSSGFFEAGHQHRTFTGEGLRLLQRSLLGDCTRYRPAAGVLVEGELPDYRPVVRSDFEGFTVLDDFHEAIKAPRAAGGKPSYGLGYGRPRATADRGC